MGNIVLLDELTINQIAAGEVIERPASVVKEMVENSIDAGATNITVEIKNGGISYIRIIDNGKGFEKDDLEIAFERHATSKIRCANDLETVTSMGFRGEALASIAAISNIELVSKTSDMEIGNKIVVEAGNILEKEEAACQKGTTITVKNLFFNTPVRYKFLRKDYTEAGYIEDVITRIALVNPHISIKLISAGKTVIQTNGSNQLKNVVYSIYGKDVANAIIELEYTYEDYKISGVIGKPEIARSNRSNQLFFVNKRFVKDKTLSAATEQAYKGLIPLGKFGFLILNIEMNPSKVDVNVHPAKLEVRFVEESKVFQAILHGIKDTLLKSELVANVSRPIEEKKSIDRALTFEQRLLEIKQNKENKDIKKEKTGLFSFRKNNEEKQMEGSETLIEKLYNHRNNIEEKDEADNQSGETEIVNTKIGISNPIQVSPNISGNIEPNINLNTMKTDINDPINTEDILLQLKQMKEKIEKELNVKEGQEEIKKVEDLEEANKLQEDIEEYRVEEAENIKATDDKVNIDFQEQKMEGNKIEENKINDLGKSNESKEIVIDETIRLSIPQSENLLDEEINESILQKEEINKEKFEDIEQKNNIEDIDNAHKIIEEINNEEVQKEFQEIKQKMKNLNDNPKIVSDDFNEMYAKMFGKLPTATVETDINQEDEKSKILKDILNSAQESVFEKIDEETGIQPYKIIGVVFKTYIILEIEKEMYILDQHAAHERIMYEKIKENYYSSILKDSQMLLLPDIITLTHKEMDITRENMQMFIKAGFNLEEFGDNTIKLTGVPTVCFELDTKELFIETLDEINTVARTAKQEKEEKFIATVACKAAVKGNMSLAESEIKILLDKLLKLPNPFTCPHGRPTAIKMSKDDIERKFARK